MATDNRQWRLLLCITYPTAERIASVRRLHCRVLHPPSVTTFPMDSICGRGCSYASGGLGLGPRSIGVCGVRGEGTTYRNCEFVAPQCALQPLLRTRTVTGAVAVTCRVSSSSGRLSNGKIGPGPLNHADLT